MVSGISNETPPISTARSDWVSTLIPEAESEKSTPLAFQKRVSAVTRASCGAATKTSMLIALPSGSSA